MTTTEQQRAIAYITRAVRANTPACPAFDEPGIMAALTRVQHINLAIVAMAAIRCAADPSIKTPAMIGDPSSSVYRERVGPDSGRRNPRPLDSCHRCGNAFGPSCCDMPTQRPAPGDYTTHAAQARAALRATP